MAKANSRLVQPLASGDYDRLIDEVYAAASMIDALAIVEFHDVGKDLHEGTRDSLLREAHTQLQGVASKLIDARHRAVQ